MQIIVGHTVDYVLLDLNPHKKNPNAKKGKRCPKKKRADMVFQIVEDPDKDAGFSKGSVLSADSVATMLTKGVFTESTIMCKGGARLKIIGNPGKEQSLQVLVDAVVGA